MSDNQIDNRMEESLFQIAEYEHRLRELCEQLVTCPNENTHVDTIRRIKRISNNISTYCVRIEDIVVARVQKACKHVWKIDLTDYGSHTSYYCVNCGKNQHYI